MRKVDIKKVTDVMTFAWPLSHGVEVGSYLAKSTLDNWDGSKIVS